MKAIDFLLMGFCVAEIDGNIIDADRAYLQLHGLGSVNPVGRNLVSSTHPDDIPQALRITGHVASTGTPQVYRQRSLKETGEVMWVENRVSLLREGAKPRLLIACRALDFGDLAPAAERNKTFKPHAIADYVANLNEGLQMVSLEAGLSITADIQKLARKIAPIEAALNSQSTMVQ
ncbi:MAG: PAS domain S-box protein [Caulobacteraceae bacterium]